MQGIRKLIDTRHLADVLADFAQDLKENYLDHLADSGREATGALMQSVRDNRVEDMVKIGDQEFTISINLADYWKYVEVDTRPHWPPQDAILAWIEAKPIIPRPGKDGSIPSPKSLAFLIARAMAGESPYQSQCKNPQGGTTGTYDLERTREGLVGIYRERIAEAMRMDIENYLEQVWKPGAIREV